MRYDAVTASDVCALIQLNVLNILNNTILIAVAMVTHIESFLLFRAAPSTRILHPLNWTGIDRGIRLDVKKSNLVTYLIFH